MRSTPIILDRLAAALEKHGVKMKRAALLETAATAFGYHNAAEFSANDTSGELQPPHAITMGQVTIGDETLVILRDPSADAPYAIDASFLEGPVADQRRELFGPSPYGGLINLSDVSAHPLTVWGVEAGKAMTHAQDVHQLRYMAYDPEDLKVLCETDDLGTAREACRLLDGQMDLECYIVDRTDRTISRARMCWRTEELPAVAASADVAAELFMARAERDDAIQAHKTTLRIDCPDWRAWEKSLKKASHKRQEPISDELLHQFRHAVADVTSKSSSSEKFEVTYRQERYVNKHMGGLIARLDRAEDALREAGIAPADITRKSKDDAAETLAAIEAVTTRRKDLSIHDLYEVEATRDGDKCRETFLVENGQDPEDRGREIAANQFRMNLEDYRFPPAGSPDEEMDDDGNVIPDYSSFDSECDTFEVNKVFLPEAAAIIGDALGDLSSTRLEYGLPHHHPVRIKLLAAVDKLRPKPTV